MKTKFLILGGGITGLSFAYFLKDKDFLVLEKENGVGGYCKTTINGEYVWDYAGHFFHFKNNDIRNFFYENIECKILEVQKKAKIYYKDKLIDSPFQNNIHQLSKQDFIKCLIDLYSVKKENVEYENFKSFVYNKLGKSISESFVIPYNEKVYSCNLDDLDINCMGRFFPDTNLDIILNNMKDKKNNSSYNDFFIYPEFGAFEFVKCFLKKIDSKKILTNCEILKIDRHKKIAFTKNGAIEFDYLINTTPFNRFLKIMSENVDVNKFSNAKTLIFNIGFNSKGVDDIHWIYYPEKKYNFYRVGFYDNILNKDKMNIYVEIGFNSNDLINIEKEYEKSIIGLKKCGIIENQKVIDYNYFIMDPSYVHISDYTKNLLKEKNDMFVKNNIFSIGRYGGWTYCSIEDNITESLTLINKIKNENLCDWNR